MFCFVVMNLWALTQNWLPSGLENVRIFFEIFGAEIMKMGRQEKGGEVMLYGMERGKAQIYAPSYMRFSFSNKIRTFSFVKRD